MTIYDCRPFGWWYKIFYMAPRGLHGEGRHVAVQDSQVTFMNLVAFMGSTLRVSFIGS